MNKSIRMGIYTFFLYACFFMSAPLEIDAFSKEIVAGVYDNKPMIFMTESGPRGLFVDVLENIAKKEDWKITYQHGTWDEVYNRLIRKEIDILPAVAFNESRLTQLDFSKETLISNWGQVYARKNLPLDSIQNLEGKKIATLSNDIHGEHFKNLLSQLGISYENLSIENYTDIFRALEAGTCDAAVINYLAALNYSEKYNIQATPIVFNPIQIRYAVPKGDPAGLLTTADKHIAIFKADKSSMYYTSMADWFGAYISRPPQFPAWIQWTLITISGITLLLLAGNVFLQARVRARTRDLSVELNHRRQAEDELKKQKYFLQKAQEIGNIGTWELDIKKNELVWTEENYKIFGLPLGSKLTYETFLNVVHPDDREYVDAKWKAAFKREPYDIEHRLTVDCKVKWVKEKAELEFNEMNECIRGIGFAQDITDRKTSEIQLREAIDRFKKIFNSQFDAIFVLSAEKSAVILECNHAAVDIFGYDSKDLIGYPVDKLHVDAAQLETFQNQLFASVRSRGYLRHFEFSMKRKDGTTFPSEHTVMEMKDDSGLRTGWISIVRDLSTIRNTESALMDSEDKFKILFHNAPLSYQSLDENGNFIEVNQTWLSVLGYEKEEVMGRNFGEFLHPDWQEHFRTNFPRFKAVGEVLGVEFEMLKKDGSYILVSFHGKIGHTPDGEFKQTHCVFRDITGQRRLESEKAVLEAELQQSRKMEAIGTLAGGIAHDFNNILFPIVGHAEMLLDDFPEPGPVRNSLNEIYTGALRAKDLVQQILAFSRQEKKELKLMKMQPIIKEALKLIRSSIPATISITQDLQPDCGAVKADPTQIHQIIINLTTNAWHAMEDEGGELVVSLKDMNLDEHDAALLEITPGLYACLMIADTGVGIDKTVITRIFEPFFTTKEKGKGTGMGLSVVHGIVKNMNGAIQVHSELGKGTTFHIYLSVAGIETESQGTCPDESIPVGQERILVVDDEKAIVAMEKQILDRLGYQVTAYTRSVDALEAFRNNPDQFDLVIMDMSMPEIPGDKLAVEIIKIRQDIPVLLCTGFSESMTDEKIKHLGIRGLLMKPIARKDLAGKIREIFSGTSGQNNGLP